MFVNIFAFLQVTTQWAHSLSALPSVDCKANFALQVQLDQYRAEWTFCLGRNKCQVVTVKIKENLPGLGGGQTCLHWVVYHIDTNHCSALHLQFQLLMAAKKFMCFLFAQLYIPLFFRPWTRQDNCIGVAWSICAANEACSRTQEAARLNSARILDFYGIRLQSPALRALH